MDPQRTFLLIEDDYVDQMTIQRALHEIQADNPLHIVNNGEEALAFLRDENNVKPTIILLDLNMPRMNGIEFLKIVKEDEALKRIPVIVLTTSKEEQDKVNSFDLGVAGYMIKPVGYKQFVKVMRTINLYWTMSETAE